MRNFFDFSSKGARARAMALAMMVVLGVFATACGGGEETRGDDQIRQEALAALEAANLEGVTVEVHDGVLTLGGSVYTQADADRAARTVTSIQGVTSVESRIAVGGSGTPGVGPVPALTENPDASPDAMLGAKVAQAFRANPALAGSSITPSVAGGVATLTGTVPSDAAKAEAERVAKSIAGVTSVDNRLEVKAVEIVNVPDKQVEADVRTLLDQSYPDYSLSPQVTNGVVKLRGAVSSNREIREITERVAKIKGVKAVDTKLLAVEGSEGGEERIGAPATNAQ